MKNYTTCYAVLVHGIGHDRNIEQKCLKHKVGQQIWGASSKTRQKNRGHIKMFKHGSFFFCCLPCESPSSWCAPTPRLSYSFSSIERFRCIRSSVGNLSKASALPVGMPISDPVILGEAWILGEGRRWAKDMALHFHVQFSTPSDIRTDRTQLTTTVFPLEGQMRSCLAPIKSGSSAEWSSDR